MTIPIDAVNEDTTMYLDIDFVDGDGSPVVPITAEYSIWCLTNDQEVVAKKNIGAAPAASMVLTITPEDNALIDGGNPYEVRKLVIDAVYEMDGTVVIGAFVKEYQYEVRRVRRPA